MNRLAPLVARPVRNAFDPAGVVRDPPAMAWVASALDGRAPRRWQDDMRTALVAYAAGIVVFGTLFA